MKDYLTDGSPVYIHPIRYSAVVWACEADGVLRLWRTWYTPLGPDRSAGRERINHTLNTRENKNQFTARKKDTTTIIVSVSREARKRMMKNSRETLVYPTKLRQLGWGGGSGERWAVNRQSERETADLARSQRYASYARVCAVRHTSSCGLQVTPPLFSALFHCLSSTKVIHDKGLFQPCVNSHSWSRTIDWCKFGHVLGSLYSAQWV